MHKKIDPAINRMTDEKPSKLGTIILALLTVLALAMYASIGLWVTGQFG